MLHSLHLKHTTSSLCLINRPTYKSPWLTVHNKYICATSGLPRALLSTGIAQDHGPGLMQSIMARPLTSRRQLPERVLRIIDWPYKSPQVFSVYFIVVHMLPGKLPGRSPIIRFLRSKYAYLRSSYEWDSRKERYTLVDIGSYFISCKPQSRCYIHPNLKSTTFSLCLTNRMTYKPS